MSSEAATVVTSVLFPLFKYIIQLVGKVRSRGLNTGCSARNPAGPGAPASNESITERTETTTPLLTQAAVFVFKHEALKAAQKAKCVVITQTA